MRTSRYAAGPWLGGSTWVQMRYGKDFSREFSEVNQSNPVMTPPKLQRETKICVNVCENCKWQQETFKPIAREWDIFLLLSFF